MEEINEIEETVTEAKTQIVEQVSDMDNVIEEWFSKHFHGVYGLEVQLYNKFYNAKEELKKTIKGL